MPVIYVNYEQTVIYFNDRNVKFVFYFQMMKGDFYVVEYQFWDKTYTEILQSDKLRPVVDKSASNVDKSMFFKFEIEVPEDVRE